MTKKGRLYRSDPRSSQYDQSNAFIKFHRGDVLDVSRPLLRALALTWLQTSATVGYLPRKIYREIGKDRRSCPALRRGREHQ